MSYFQNPDTVQCQVIGTDGKRCTRKGTNSGGTIIRCSLHHRKYLVDRVNNALIERKKK